MSGLSPAEIITLSFYAWEVRGRGWTLAPYPVSLEPPYRPFHILPGLVASPEVIDDGKRPTILSSLLGRARNALLPSPRATLPVPIDDWEEPTPYPAPDAPELVSLHLRFPEGYAIPKNAMQELFTALSTTLHPVAYEIVGSGGQVRVELVCAAFDREQVEAQLLSFAPEVSVITGMNLIESVWRNTFAHAVVDFGLSHEFFLPLRNAESFPLDPYVTLIPMLARACEGECVAVQVLVEGVRNPWSTAVMRAISDGEGGCLIADAPEFPKLAALKTHTPLFAVSLRVFAQAESEERAWDLAKGTSAFFRQFARSGGNELIPLENDGYPDGEHADSVRRYESYRTGMLLSAEEHAVLAHFPDASVTHPALARITERTKALPERARGHTLILGQNEHRGVRENATQGTETRLEHTWIIGATGSGKSNLLLNLILQDIHAGEGIAVLDPHGDLIDDILGQIPERRIADIVLFDPSDAEHPIGFNILQAESDIERTLLSSDLVGVFRRLSSSWGDTMSTVLGNAVLAILESTEGGTLLTLRRFLVDERFRKEYLATIRDEEIRFFWTREYPLIGSRSIGPILTRLDTFLRPKLIRHIVGQKEGKLDLSSVMRNRKVFLGKLSQGLIGEENAYLLGSLLLGKFQELALARQQLAQGERTPFFLYADEFHNFITPSLETLLTGARKYGLGLTLAHQTLAQIAPLPRVESALFGNAHTRIVFRTGELEARKLAEGFSTFTADDIVGLGRGEAIVRLGTARDDFNLHTYPAPRFKNAETDAIRQSVTTSSQRQYGTPLHTFTASLASLYGRDEVLNKPLAVPEGAPIQYEDTHPEHHAVTETPPAPPPAKKKSGAAPQQKLSASFASGRGGHEHKYLQHLVKRLAEERGFRATLEERAGTGRADVVLRKASVSVGVEISVTTDIEHEADNIEKCLAAGFTYVAFISVDAKRRRALVTRFVDRRPKLWVCRPEEIVGMLDAVDPGALKTESTVRGYKVKVTRQAMTPEDAASRRSAVAAVMVKSMRKGLWSAEK